MIRLLREPLLWFLLAGAIAFAIDRAGPEAVEQPGTIVVDAKLREAIVEQQELFLSRAISAEEEAVLVQRYVDEEVLVREALRRGLDRNDGRIRQILLQKMTFLLGSNPGPPDEATLIEWFEENEERFLLPEIRNVEHVFFQDASQATPDVLAALRSGDKSVPEGDPFWLGRRLEGYSRTDLEAVLGSSFAQAVFDAPAGHWMGPVASARGTHFLRIEAVRPARIPSFETLRSEATDEWIAEQAARGRERRLGELRRNYRIVITPPVDESR